MPPRAHRRRQTTTALTRSAADRKRLPPTKSRASEERARRKTIKDQEGEKARSMCRIRMLQKRPEPESDENRATADPMEEQERNEMRAHDPGEHTDEGDPCSAGQRLQTEEPRTRLLMEIGPFC
jgi:hypothetical protein